MWIYVAIAGSSAALLCWLLRKKSPLSDIPGPKPWPLVGNLPQLNIPKLFLNLDEFSRKYGGIFKVYMFNSPVVVVSDAALVQEVLVTQSAQFGGRPRFSYRYKLLSENLLGITMTDEGPEHRGRRKVLHSFLHQFGNGIARLEEVTMSATDELVAMFREKNGEAVDVKDYLFRCVTDVTVILLTGKQGNEEEMQELQRILEQGFASKHQASGMVLDIFPFTRFLGNKRYHELQEVIDAKERIVRQWFDDNPEQGLIHYIQSMDEKEQKQNCLHAPSDQSKTVFEFLAGGVFNTFTTLTCLMNVLCHYPEVQARLQHEILDVVGPSRKPTLKDRENLPYLRATLMEIGRYASVTPIAVPHKTIQTCELRGYTIPEDTQVWVNLWALHHNESLWPEPFCFRPERFLDAEGKLVMADHPSRRYLLPFGAGHRVCVGEVFAVCRMFLIVCRLLQTFSILPETTLDRQPSCDPREMTMGIALKPQPFKVRIVPHNLS